MGQQESIYHGALEEIVNSFFRRQPASFLVAKGVSGKLVLKDVTTEEQVLDYYSDLMAVDVLERYKFNFDCLPIESEFANVVYTKYDANCFWDTLQRLLRDGVWDKAASQLKFDSVVQKALAQRDLNVICSTLDSILPATDNNPLVSETIIKAKGLRNALLFGDDELGALETMLRGIYRSSDIAEVKTAEILLNENQSRGDWIELPIRQEKLAHYIHYKRNSTIGIFLNIPTWKLKDLMAVKNIVDDKFGGALASAREGDLPILPDGARSLLVRTARIVDRAGVLRRTFLIEEIIGRTFVTGGPKPDMKTSDFRGTNLFQFKLDRLSLLRGAANGKLFLPDDPVFVGFNSDAIDLRVAHRPVLTTMRMNCVNCHSAEAYGLKTIFSLNLLESSHHPSEGQAK